MVEGSGSSLFLQVISNSDLLQHLGKCGLCISDVLRLRRVSRALNTCILKCNRFWRAAYPRAALDQLLCGVAYSEQVIGICAKRHWIRVALQARKSSRTLSSIKASCQSKLQTRRRKLQVVALEIDILEREYRDADEVHLHRRNIVKRAKKELAHRKVKPREISEKLLVDTRFDDAHWKVNDTVNYKPQPQGRRTMLTVRRVYN